MLFRILFIFFAVFFVGVCLSAPEEEKNKTDKHRSRRFYPSIVTSPREALVLKPQNKKQSKKLSQIAAPSAVSAMNNNNQLDFRILYIKVLGMKGGEKKKARGKDSELGSYSLSSGLYDKLVSDLAHKLDFSADVYGTKAKGQNFLKEVDLVSIRKAFVKRIRQKNKCAGVLSQFHKMSKPQKQYLVYIIKRMVDNKYGCTGNVDEDFLDLLMSCFFMGI